MLGLTSYPGNKSFMIFEGHAFPQIITMIFIFIGGVGFWPLAEFAIIIKAKI